MDIKTINLPSLMHNLEQFGIAAVVKELERRQMVAYRIGRDDGNRAVTALSPEGLQVLISKSIDK